MYGYSNEEIWLYIRCTDGTDGVKTSQRPHQLENKMD